MDKKLIIANWKMNPTSPVEAEEILEFVNDYLESMGESKELSLVFCPPFVFLEDLNKLLKSSHLGHEAFLGAQDISTEDSGAMTGEVSGPMLKKLGVDYAIIGHSERRWKLNESDNVVNRKLKAALRNEFLPIVCIGEKTRDDNFGAFIEDQILKTFEGLTSEEMSKCLIAYEPVWAISSNPGARPDNPESAMESVEIIKNTIIENWKLEIENLPKTLYGGSVNSKNVADFLKADFDGVLVGSASVNKNEFVSILRIAAGIE